MFDKSLNKVHGDQNLMQIRGDLLAKINKHMKFLRLDIELLRKLLQKHNYDVEVISSSPYVLMATERLLERIISNMIDIASMVAKFSNLMGLYELKSYKLMFNVLCYNKILSSDLCASLPELIEIRDMLIYEYVEFQLQKIEGELRDKIQDFEQFAKQVRKFLDTIKD